MRKNVITDYLVDEPAPGGGVREAVITAGVPGAGKSTAVNAILGADASQYRRVDADEIKDALLEDAVASNLYADLLGRRLADDKPVAPRELAALVHVESTQISDAVRRHVLTSGEPIIIEGTLAWAEHGTRLLTELQEAGYTRVRVILVEVPEAVAQERALDRGGGKCAATEVTRSVGGSPRPTSSPATTSPTGSACPAPTPRRLSVMPPTTTSQQSWRRGRSDDGRVQRPRQRGRGIPGNRVM